MSITKANTALGGIVLLICWFGSISLAQQKDINNSSSVQKEQVLEAIHVEAKIEKPSVSIIPKRIEPPLEEVEFVRRSFDRELKSLPQQMINFALGRSKVREIYEVKKILAKDRKLLYISSRVMKESPKFSRR
ncbi:hypothetical protein DRP98_01235 [candidate division KSB1 bacterium]|nr:hypothetical protein [bacterium]OQX60631.1 MAG: hypothetical protein B5M50_00600 [candidate division KSB1 bacterium 4484_219]RKY79058.1 MAG: hypothetical protein DRQ12_04650 [candidate division KSB1 bacterium]HDI52308.1 hypothetical protein [Bacteroidota bacterium]RKY81061.1 MAG: hypothetical protein DRQ00_00790 [candidate division KSB1 bacterium]